MIIVAQHVSKTDNFAVADKNGLTRTGFTWTQPNANFPRIVSQTAGDPTGFVSGYWPAVFTQQRLYTDTHYASAFVAVEALTTIAAGLIVGADSALSGYGLCLISSTNVILGYGTGPAANQTFQFAAKGSAPSSTAQGAAWRYEKHIASNGALYRIWCNSTLELEYLDTALTVPNGENNRYCGLAVQRSGFSGCANWDDFTASDLS